MVFLNKIGCSDVSGIYVCTHTYTQNHAWVNVKSNGNILVVKCVHFRSKHATFVLMVEVGSRFL